MCMTFTCTCSWSYITCAELEEEVRQKWFELVKKVEETNKKNMCIPVVS